MLIDFKLYNVYADCPERENWSILSTKICYAEYERKAVPSNKTLNQLR